MNAIAHGLPLALALLLLACGSGRVRAGQGTEVRQEEVYAPETKAEPPEGNINRWPETYPVLEVDLERKPQPYQPDSEPKTE